MLKIILTSLVRLFSSMHFIPAASFTRTHGTYWCTRKASAENNIKKKGFGNMLLFVLLSRFPPCFYFQYAGIFQEEITSQCIHSDTESAWFCARSPTVSMFYFVFLVSFGVFFLCVFFLFQYFFIFCSCLYACLALRIFSFNVSCKISFSPKFLSIYIYSCKTPINLFLSLLPYKCVCVCVRACVCVSIYRRIQTETSYSILASISFSCLISRHRLGQWGLENYQLPM